MTEGGGKPRRARVAQTMRDLLSRMIDREVKDPRVREAGLVNVNQVELNRDMSIARVYVSFLGASDQRVIDRAMKGLDAAARFLRGPLARQMTLARAPALRFVHDTSPELWSRLSEIVAEDERRARAASADGDTTPDGEESDDDNRTDGAPDAGD